MLPINEIIHGRAEEVLPTLPAASIPLFVFSPPYNLNADDTPMTQRGGSGKWRGGGKWQNGGAYDGYDDAMPWPAYAAWQQAVLRACWRCLSDDGAIFYVHKPRLRGGTCVTPLDYNPGLPVRQIIIWARAGGINMAMTHFMPAHEWIVVFAKPAFRLRSQGVSGLGDVWRIPQEANTWHPAPFPLALAERVIDATTAPLVCDPFIGSGTTALAAKRLGRTYIGIEQSAAYVARARIALGEAVVDSELGPLFHEV